MIKIGGKIGALNTISLIFLTAIIGLYFAKLQGIKTIREGVTNLYQNKAWNELCSGKEECTWWRVYSSYFKEFNSL